MALHHRRRYTRRTLLRALVGTPLELCHLSYINSLALLPIGVYRVARRFGMPMSRSRLEDQVVPEPLNTILRSTFVEPACWPIRQPIGVSLLCVLRRRDG